MPNPPAKRQHPLPLSKKEGAKLSHIKMNVWPAGRLKLSQTPLICHFVSGSAGGPGTSLRSQDFFYPPTTPCHTLPYHSIPWHTIP